MHDYSIVQAGGNDPHTRWWCVDCGTGDVIPTNDDNAYRTAHKAGQHHKKTQETA